MTTPYVIVAVLTFLAALLVVIGLRFAERSSIPTLFRVGAFTAAAGLMLLWIGFWWVFSVDRGVWAMPLFIAALFIPISLLGLGLQLMARACGVREESHNEQLFSEFVRRNDL
jgi:hypothetical protein